VLFRSERLHRPSAWEEWRFVIREVVPDDGSFGHAPRQLRDDGRQAWFVHPRLPVRLHRDEAAGYHLNLVSGAPVWFVMWRTSEDDPGNAWPEIVTLSYNEAARWLDAQEHVDNAPLQSDARAWLQTWVDAHYRPEPKERKRPASFRAPHERQRP
jgi:hypothetical protein